METTSCLVKWLGARVQWFKRCWQRGHARESRAFDLRNFVLGPNYLMGHDVSINALFQSCTVRNLDEWCNSQVWLVSENGYRFITSFGQKMTTIKRRHLSNISKFRL
ncbi:hypothetical protein AVEN_219987-1 [Araneus ventricosus]|uniref:Uncharacterized protein n=1 Tax=Araneus ventricosus TaxID=182803 RepID=A0A4Y2WGV3_ARAVE|nr:hypothetical protein AVEN_219987-1 [Araneus ventricosus]